MMLRQGLALRDHRWGSCTSRLHTWLFTPEMIHRVSSSTVDAITHYYSALDSESSLLAVSSFDNSKVGLFRSISANTIYTPVIRVYSESNTGGIVGTLDQEFVGHTVSSWPIRCSFLHTRHRTATAYITISRTHALHRLASRSAGKVRPPFGQCCTENGGQGYRRDGIRR